MCGIAGIFHREGRSALTGSLEAMANSMRRRGPDDEGYMVFGDFGAIPARGTGTVQGPLTGNFRQISGLSADSFVAGMAHRRLSVIDVTAAGHQPMVRGRHWMVFNGEIFNHPQLRTELEAEGERFLSRSDTEVLLAAWVRWGPDALRRLDGMFAFAVYDSGERTLDLVRDRLGIKPLYYTSLGDRTVFASDLKAVLASGLISPEVDMESLWHNLSLGITPRPRTLLKNVFAVPQAGWLRFRSSHKNPEETRYWTPPRGVQPSSSGIDQESERIRGVLAQAVERAMESDVEVAAFLSGGVDSGVVAAIASMNHRNPRVFTLGFEEELPEYEETALATQTARKHGLRQTVVRVKASDLAGRLEEVVDALEEPFFSLPPGLLMAEAVADHGVKVVLSGLGGDELFAGYPHYARLKYAWSMARRFAPVSGIFRMFPRTQMMGRFAECETLDEFYMENLSQFSDVEKHQLFGKSYAPTRRLMRDFYNIRLDGFRDQTEALSYLDWVCYIGNHHVHRQDQFGMRRGLECRFPYLDHRLIEAVAATPEQFKVLGGRQKILLKRIAASLLPNPVLSARKRGFRLPMRLWIDGPLRAIKDEALRRLIQRGFFVPKAVEQTIAADPFGYKTWMLVMVELWWERFIENGDLSWTRGVR